MLGYTAGGWCQYEAYRPSVKSFSDEVTEARKAKLNPSSRVCLPHGWDFDIINGKGLLIEPSEADYVRLVKASGASPTLTIRRRATPLMLLRILS